MPPAEKLDTHQKALAINLDQSIFGSFAEIGAGQEVARWFLQVGGASGTVAKTVSAYDKEVSDDLYGTGTRYVSMQRLEAMLDREWNQLLAQVQETRGLSTRFFSFADTVSARNFAGTNECHGWMGIRFQAQPGGGAQDILLHLNLRDPSNLSQQEIVGVVGVNLIDAVFHQRQDKKSLLRALLDQASLQRVEIDFIDVRGTAFESWNSQELLLTLVLEGLAEAVVLPAGDRRGSPSEILRKRPIVLVPLTNENPRPIHREILSCAMSKLKTEAGEAAREPLGLLAVSTAPADLLSSTPKSFDVSRGVQQLQTFGADVLVSSYSELYRMTAFVNRYTQAPVRFAVELPTLIRVFSEAYGHLEGRLLEALSRLFAQNVRVYVFPMAISALHKSLNPESSDGWRWEANDGWIFADQLYPPPPLGHVYAFLLASKFILPMPPIS
jgi:hypothetical protein